MNLKRETDALNVEQLSTKKQNIACHQINTYSSNLPVTNSLGRQCIQYIWGEGGGGGEAGQFTYFIVSCHPIDLN